MKKLLIQSSCCCLGGYSRRLQSHNETRGDLTLFIFSYTNLSIFLVDKKDRKKGVFRIDCNFLALCFLFNWNWILIYIGDPSTIFLFKIFLLYLILVILLVVIFLVLYTSWIFDYFKSCIYNWNSWYFMIFDRVLD